MSRMSRTGQDVRTSMTLARLISYACVMTLVLAGAGCHRKSARVRPPRPPAARPSTSPSLPEVVPGATELGYASWYGNPYHGRKTASGEVYNMYALTAAHRTLPLGTEVEVTNMENSRKVTVRINDRGPFVDGRVIDLSLSAARIIEMVGPGTAMVQVKVLRLPGGPASPAASATMVAAAAPPSQALPADDVSPQAAQATRMPQPTRVAQATRMAQATPLPVADTPVVSPPPAAGVATARFVAQVGAFSDKRNAERLQESLARRYPEYAVTATPASDGALYRVWVGNETSQQAASAIVERLRNDGVTAFTVRVD